MEEGNCTIWSTVQWTSLEVWKSISPTLLQKIDQEFASEFGYSPELHPVPESNGLRLLLTVEAATPSPLLYAIETNKFQLSSCAAGITLRPLFEQTIAPSLHTSPKFQFSEKDHNDRAAVNAMRCGRERIGARERTGRASQVTKSSFRRNSKSYLAAPFQDPTFRTRKGS